MTYHMMLNIADLSDHSSSIASDRDPFGDFMDGVPGDEGMDMTESYQRLPGVCVWPSGQREQQ